MWFPTLFDSVKTARSRTPVCHRRRPAGYGLAVEVLEDRLVPASLSVSDFTLLEGNTGSTNAIVTVTLSAPSAQTVTVQHYSTADGTALAGSDYQAVSGKLTFAPGETSKSILVPVFGDRVLEPDETIIIKPKDRKECDDRRRSGDRHHRQRRAAPPTISIDVSVSKATPAQRPSRSRRTSPARLAER